MAIACYISIYIEQAIDIMNINIIDNYVSIIIDQIYLYSDKWWTHQQFHLIVPFLCHSICDTQSPEHNITRRCKQWHSEVRGGEQNLKGSNVKQSSGNNELVQDKEYQLTMIRHCIISSSSITHWHCYMLYLSYRSNMQCPSTGHHTAKGGFIRMP